MDYAEGFSISKLKASPSGTVSKPLGSLPKIHKVSFLFFLLILSGSDHVYFENPRQVTWICISVEYQPLE